MTVNVKIRERERGVVGDGKRRKSGGKGEIQSAGLGNTRDKRAKRERSKMVYTIKEERRMGKIGEENIVGFLMGVHGRGGRCREGKVQIQNNFHVYTHTPEHNSCTYT